MILGSGDLFSIIFLIVAIVGTVNLVITVYISKQWHTREYFPLKTKCQPGIGTVVFQRFAGHRVYRQIVIRIECSDVFVCVILESRLTNNKSIVSVYIIASPPFPSLAITELFFERLAVHSHWNGARTRK